MQAPKVAIILLNWNGIQDTLECLASVFAIDYPNFDVIVADNGSRDQQGQRIKQQYPQITLIENGGNLGFAEGNNVAIRHALDAGADHVLLLNNDTTIDPAALTGFADAIRRFPEAGIYGAKIYYHANPRTLWYAGARWDRRRGGFVHVGMGEEDDNQSHEQISEQDYITGCALLVARTVIERIGVMDPRFFVYFEETDWCHRARRAGFRCLLVPAAKVWHKVSASTGGSASPVYHYYMSRNLLLFVGRNFDGLDRAARYLSALLGLFFAHALARFDPDRPASLARRLYWDLCNLGAPATRVKAMGVLDFLLGRFGKATRPL